MDRTRDMLTTLLENIASRAEIEQYLHDFGAARAATFAVIKVGGGVLRDDMDDLASALALLHRLGLIPVVVHGAGPQINAALEEAGVPTQTVEGLRVTTPEVLKVVRRVLQQVNAGLAHALEVRGARARPIVSGVFEASIQDRRALGFVGAVTGVHHEPITAALRSGCLPVVACLAESADGQILNINGDVAACELAAALRPGKIVFLTPTGGLLDEHDRIVPAINLVEDAPALLAEPWVTGGMALKIKQIADLLDRLPAESSVSITSPGHLARELFTHRGCGTLVRRGEPIRRYDGLDGVDHAALRTTLESSFRRELAPSYFGRLQPRDVLVAGDYVAAAILTEQAGVPYLDKFAVTARAQGLGLGASLWSRIRALAPRLLWRSREDNPINPWYFKHSDGMRRRAGWVVFWYGLGEDEAELRRSVEHVAALPESWVGPAPAVTMLQEQAHAIAR
jgi:acetylglutamate kinase